MTAQNNIISLIWKNLIQCGYSEPLLQNNYVYGDGIDTRTVPLAAFSSPVHDSRTSCISVIKCDELLGATEQYVNQFRGFGAPVIFVCCNGSLQWWNLGTSGAKYEKTVSKGESKAFFTSYKQKFSPDRIWRAKNLGRVETKHQLNFVDIGLMPLLEEEMGERLGELMKRVIGSLRNGFSIRQLEQHSNQRWIFQAGFWLLCAKILQDKHVKNFIRLDITNVDAAIEAVKTHYGAREGITFASKRQKEALEAAAAEVSKFASLSNLTTEAFGYMYENVLVDKKLRSALGIHATPSYLVDYIVWQLWPWIQEMQEEKRFILEPACGHAPFLTNALRLLRELFDGDEKSFHKYAQNRLIAIEMDPFAREIARLSLTMADVPKSDGWNIIEEDIYLGNTLSKNASKVMVLLCNPPFEDFTPKEQDAYKKAGESLQFFNKAAEMLWRTLPSMPKGSVFGVILPQGFLYRKNLAELRKMILNEFGLCQICTLPKKVFAYAKHPSVLMFGRKKTHQLKGGRTGDNRILYRHIPQDRLKEFKEKYAGRDQYVTQSKLIEAHLTDLRLRVLEDVWDYCERNFPILDSISEGGQGLIYKGRHLPQGAKTVDKIRFAGAVKGYALFDSDIEIHRLPKEYWLSIEPEVIRRPMWGLQQGEAQILMNYAPVSADPWRLKALIDRKGLPVSGRFLVFRPKSHKWSLNALWGILNSPLANAFIFAHTTDRDIPSGVAKKIPIPSCTKSSLQKLEGLVAEYFALMKKKDSEFGFDVRNKAKQLLLLIDAKVMRLYDLPPKMEKRILDLFQGIQRKGVDFEFKGYYPEGFESAVPLHEYLSEEYQRSTVMFADDWVKKYRSPEINEVLRTATEAFEEK